MSKLTSFTRNLKGLIEVYLKLRTETGLLIRMPVHAQAYRIGGADQYPMITKKTYRGIGELEIPYIPGSSLKGRMRGLLELALGKKLYSSDQKIWQHVRGIAMDFPDLEADIRERCIIDELFGYAAVNYKQLKEMAEKKVGETRAEAIASQLFSNLAITRILVDDFFPTEEFINRTRARSIADFLEEKSENRIDRVTSAADPRDIVRVKPGVEFEGKLTLLLFDNDSDMVEKYLKTITAGLRLIEETYLGGSGSRGYGRIKFIEIGVEALKIAVSDGTLKLEKTSIGKYSNIAELEEKISDLSGKIREYIFAK